MCVLVSIFTALTRLKNHIDRRKLKKTRYAVICPISLSAKKYFRFLTYETISQTFFKFFHNLFFSLIVPINLRSLLQKHIPRRCYYSEIGCHHSKEVNPTAVSFLRRINEYFGIFILLHDLFSKFYHDCDEIQKLFGEAKNALKPDLIRLKRKKKGSLFLVNVS